MLRRRRRPHGPVESPVRTDDARGRQSDLILNQALIYAQELGDLHRRSIIHRQQGERFARELKELYDADRRRTEVSRERMASNIRRALQPGAIAAFFQPIVDLSEGMRVGVEALSRFSVEPARGPDVWFEEAREAGLLDELECGAIRTIAEQVAALPAGTYLSFNVSPSTIMTDRFGEALASIDHADVVVEITEHAAVQDYSALHERLREIRAGARLAVDDAGAGFASLRHILLLEPDVIKLDVSLTRDIERHRGKRALASALISFADEMGSTIVAEGIETAAESDTLRSLGVRYGQGYLLGRPARLDEILA